MKYPFSRIAGFCAAIFLLLSITFQSSAQAQGVSYSYDALGRLSQMTYPSGAAITYVYDAA
ncbi:MAG: RHS repeat protein, partial [Alphaproteobacteria bacterium]|nr:RHS repeat protein [Alphaproteobacteria bacterium]